MRTLAEIEAEIEQAQPKADLALNCALERMRQLCRWVRMQSEILTEMARNPEWAKRPEWLDVFAKLAVEIGPLDEKPKRTIKLDGWTKPVDVEAITGIQRCVRRSGCQVDFGPEHKLADDSFEEVCAKIAESGKQPDPGWHIGSDGKPFRIGVL